MVAGEHRWPLGQVFQEGDLVFFAAGLIDEARFRASLGEVVAGLRAGRTGSRPPLFRICPIQKAGFAVGRPSRLR